MSDLQFTFLGTGTSVGVPMIGCDCEVCRSDDPRDRRTRCSVLVTTPEAALIVDSGPDLREQCLRENITEVDAVLYTHGHMDHVTGFDELRRFCVGDDETIPLYARPSVLADLRRMFAYAFSGENRYRGYIKPEPRAIAGPFTVGETLVTPLAVEHGKVETVGFLFSRDGKKRVAYIPDCKTLSAVAEEAIRGVETLVIDALRFTPHVTHMNFEEALAAVQKASPGRAFLTHFSDEVSHARDEPTLPPGVHLAYDGLKIDC